MKPQKNNARITVNANGTLRLEHIKQKKENKRLLADGRYLISGAPRSGGTASVYRAFDTQEERYIALKVFRPILGTDPVVAESFRRETQALSDLKHPNIVEILDSGFDPESEEHYIAMEWMDHDLESHLSSGQFADWESFFSTIGRPILEALTHAHSHRTIHRDIKPSNILLGSGGVVKVCDFGISKIRNFLEPGVTLAHFASFPYAPPEADDGSFSYSRDVFGFTALAVAALAETRPESHQAVVATLEQLHLGDELKRILRRALSLDNPAERQANAAVLLAQLDRLAPRAPVQKKGKILLALTRKVRNIVDYDLALRSDIEIQKFVESDLASAAYVHEPGEPRPAADGSAPLGKTIRLLGSRYGYIAVMAPPAGEQLLLVSALEQAPSDAERNRDEAAPAIYEFTFSGAMASVSAANIRDLQDELLRFGADQKALRVQQRQQAIYRTWLDLLSAKTELERQRKRRFPYRNFEVSAGFLRFAVSTDGRYLADQDIQIEITADDSFSGSVISVGDGHVSVQPGDRNRVEADALPKEGVLVVDTSKADVALDRQRAAVDAVRFGRSVNTMLGAYLVEPEAVPVPVQTDIDFIQQVMDDDKRDAVRTAMAEPAVMLVQGPPGAGKTTFITEVVLQTLARNPNARILLTSQTHVALDNSLERILKESSADVRAVRIGHEDDERISENAKMLLLDRKLPVMRKAALSKGKAFIESWAQTSGVDINNTRTAMALERHAGLRERLEEVEGQLAGNEQRLSADRQSLEPDIRADLEELQSELIREQDSLVKDIKESLGRLRRLETDKETVDHFADCSSDELRSWASSYVADSNQVTQLRKMLIAHSEWEVRFGRSAQFRAALIAQSQVVAGTCLGVMAVPGRNEITYDLCIVDEASIATPTEALVPMARARRTILVGDDRQLSPFQDPELRASGLLQRFSLSPADQKATLFNHLRDGLPAELRKVLSTQHRMVPPIGKLISACFYDSELQSAERASLGLLDRTLPRAVTWFSTSRCKGKASRPVGTSQWNALEVKHVSELLARINFELQHGQARDRQLSVAVLTGYSEQRTHLNAAIHNKRHEWPSFSDIYVNVVDAFQGREADIVIFSVTRSDANGLGFLREMERINVALSRGKEYLVIVGDHQFCEAAEEHSNPLKQVIDYIRGNPQDCALEEIRQ
ncbi:AAA domain-containing protein [Paraburkholderia phenoliruptrix]|uniref:AAA domain-containing protein n=1 Tax=Paraburkholderia phenoliruptrix TaxID=252970 RepID=UPI0028699DDF|nr:AAA domain-containing protein [Paraburkholderia phenoliruptrix]WMY08079.1 AAA domain-containing protein [Paraburkholderia phenoliruptrix]